MKVRRARDKASREYWAFVDQTAREVEEMYRQQPWLRAYARHMLCGQFCTHGNGRQTCREVT